MGLGDGRGGGGFWFLVWWTRRPRPGTYRSDPEEGIHASEGSPFPPQKWDGGFLGMIRPALGELGWEWDVELMEEIVGEW